MIICMTNLGSYFFLKSLDSLQFLIELSLWGILQYKVHTCFVVEITKQPKDVVVPMEYKGRYVKTYLKLEFVTILTINIHDAACHSEHHVID